MCPHDGLQWWERRTLAQQIVAMVNRRWEKDPCPTRSGYGEPVATTSVAANFTKSNACISLGMWRRRTLVHFNPHDLVAPCKIGEGGEMRAVFFFF
jgi:SMC interacting uncharacterized protein involved in chromosome segregation